MTLEQLAHHVGIPLALDRHPDRAPDALGSRGASPYAQATRRGVLATSLEPATAYSICHEFAHVLTGWCDIEEVVLARQAALAVLLDEPYRTRATP